MLSKLLYSLALCAVFFSSHATAKNVVKWVDENGVTHFGNAQFAPPGKSEAVNINAVNGMDVPDKSVLRHRSSNQSSKITFIKRKVVSNPRGFRGYTRRESNPNRRQRRRTF